MLTLSATTRVYLASGATDMRKSYNTLAVIVTNDLGGDPVSGHLFVFCNRRKDRIKVLYFDNGGYWLCAKRLERGTFAWPDAKTRSIELSREELLLLVAGIDLTSTRRRRWYRCG